MASKLTVYNTGYEDERFEHIVSQSFHCIICTNVIKDAVMCPQNEHLFCRACITRHLMNSQTCPTCMEPLTVETLKAPRGIRNLLAELKIQCEFFDRGCGKFIELGDLERHVTECGFAPAVCSNEGCQDEVNKQDLLHHETAVCELRRVQCHNCDDIRKEMDTMKVNLALLNEKLDRNEKRLLETLERIETKGKAVENIVQEVELIRQQLNKEDVNNRGDIADMKKSLTEITKLLERMTQQTSHEVQTTQETKKIETDNGKERAENLICTSEDKKDGYLESAEMHKIEKNEHITAYHGFTKESSSDDCDEKSPAYHSSPRESSSDDCYKESTAYHCFTKESSSDDCNKESTAYHSSPRESSSDDCNKESTAYHCFTKKSSSDDCNKKSTAYHGFTKESSSDDCNKESPAYHGFTRESSSDDKKSIASHNTTLLFTEKSQKNVSYYKDLKTNDKRQPDTCYGEGYFYESVNKSECKGKKKKGKKGGKGKRKI